MGSYFPSQEPNPCPLALEDGFFTTGPLGKSQVYFFYLKYSWFTMLGQSLLYSKVTRLYTHIHFFVLIFFSQSSSLGWSGRRLCSLQILGDFGSFPIPWDIAITCAFRAGCRLFCVLVLTKEKGYVLGHQPRNVSCHFCSHFIVKNLNTGLRLEIQPCAERPHKRLQLDYHHERMGK